MEFLLQLENILKKESRTFPINLIQRICFGEELTGFSKKVGEEAGEVIIAAKNSDKKELTHEVADLLFHLQVLLVEQGLSLQEIVEELHKRHS